MREANAASFACCFLISFETCIAAVTSEQPDGDPDQKMIWSWASLSQVVTGYAVHWKGPLQQACDPYFFVPLVIRCHYLDVTHASEPQLRFLLSLSEQSELRRALASWFFRVGRLLLGPASFKYGQAVESKNTENLSTMRAGSFFSNPLLEFCLSTPSFSCITVILFHMFAHTHLKLSEKGNLTVLNFTENFARTVSHVMQF